MFRSSYKIATVWGIPIKVHISLVVLLLIFCVEALVRAQPGYALLDVTTAFVFGVCLYTCIAFHELGHSYFALRKGCRVKQITLMLIGGAAQMERMPQRPRDELIMAIAGPAVSLLLGAVTVPLGLWLIPRTSGLWRHVSRHVFFLGAINLAWVIFNLLPAFPMDGGRILRALLTPRLGRLRATFIAARLGQLLAIVGGIFALRWSQWILVAIAVFIYALAGNELKMVELQETLKRRGFTIWPPFTPREKPRPVDDDEVQIGPPPYRAGPDSRSEIRPND